MLRTIKRVGIAPRMATVFGAQRTDGSSDRRTANRLPETPCPHCAGLRVRGVVRTTYVVYFRCEGCAHVWVVDKPDAPSASVDFAFL
jgi:hypothetical protein